MSSSIKYYKPNIVFHLAAQSLVIESQKYPQKTFETNIVGTNNVIDVVKKSSSVKSLVIATSDKCYLNKGKKISLTKILNLVVLNLIHQVSLYVKN